MSLRVPSTVPAPDPGSVPTWSVMSAAPLLVHRFPATGFPPRGRAGAAAPDGAATAGTYCGGMPRLARARPPGMRSEPGTFLIVQAGHAPATLGVLARDSGAGGGRAGYAEAVTGPDRSRAAGGFPGLRAFVPEPGNPDAAATFSDQQRSAGVHACGSVSLRVSPTMTGDGWPRCATDCRPPGGRFTGRHPAGRQPSARLPRTAGQSAGRQPGGAVFGHSISGQKVSGRRGSG